VENLRKNLRNKRKIVQKQEHALNRHLVDFDKSIDKKQENDEKICNFIAKLAVLH
jgi:hypothetical protein